MKEHVNLYKPHSYSENYSMFLFMSVRRFKWKLYSDQLYLQAIS